MICSVIKNIIAPTSSWNAYIGNKIFIGGASSSVTLPYVAMYPISREELDQANAGTERVQFSCYSTDMYNAVVTAESILTKLKLFSGSSTTYFPTLRIEGSYYDNMTYLYDSEIKGHVQILDMMFKYTR
jgi:hypothetical protein